MASPSPLSADHPANDMLGGFRQPLHWQSLRGAAGRRAQSTITDTLGTDLSGRQVVLHTLVLSRALRRRLTDAPMVGLLLPPSVPAVLSNLACLVLGRVPVNLNYTTGTATLNACLRQCGIRQVLSSRRFWDRLGLECQAEVVFLEDIRAAVTRWDKLAGWLLAQVPAGLREAWLGARRQRLDDLATVIFSSGTTGEPKGIMLSHRNILSNIAAVRRVVRLGPEDRLAGVLPFFHSFGLTGTLWLPLVMGMSAVYHVNPRDAQTVGDMIQKYQASILMAAPTFLRLYSRRCRPEQFASLDCVVAGGEKLPRSIVQEFLDHFGIEPVEGYGCTELSPVVALNLPLSRVLQPALVWNKPGTVGRPLPGMEVQVVNPDVEPEGWKPLPHGESGLLLVRGPNVMMGYLGRPDLTAQVIHDGWYVTGDVARLHPDGFIEITDRLSRFSKIGGEMVPHLLVEEAIAEFLPPSESPTFVVTAVPDARKGERLVVLHTGLPVAPDELTHKLSQRGLPNLWIPSPDSFFQVPEIPVLGTGKVDLKQSRRMACECTARVDAEGPEATV